MGKRKWPSGENSLSDLLTLRQLNLTQLGQMSESNSSFQLSMPLKLRGSSEAQWWDWIQPLDPALGLFIVGETDLNTSISTVLACRHLKSCRMHVGQHLAQIAVCYSAGIWLYSVSTCLCQNWAKIQSNPPIRTVYHRFIGQMRSNKNLKGRLWALSTFTDLKSIWCHSLGQLSRLQDVFFFCFFFLFSSLLWGPLT